MTPLQQRRANAGGLLDWGSDVVDAGVDAWNGMNTLQKASMAPVPIASDIAGVLGDIQMYSEQPDTRGLLNYGMTAASLLPFIPSVAATAGKRMSRAEAEAAGYWHPSGGTKKLKKPLPEMTKTFEELGSMEPYKNVDFESMQGGLLIPAVGDRSAANRILTGVGGTEFDTPVHLQGGKDYMRENPEGIWASGEGVVSKINNIARPAQEAGRDAYLGYMPMGWGSMDFNTMMTDSMYEQMKRGKITKKAKRAFDEAVRKLRPEWKGIDDPMSREMLDSNGQLRHSFLDVAELKEFQGQGFPDLAETRVAIADDALVNTPNLMGGQSFGRMSGETIHTPIQKHSTYPQVIGGDYVGGSEGLLGMGDMFPDWYQTRRAANKPTNRDHYSLGRSNVSQDIDQKWVDNVMGLLGR